MGKTNTMKPKLPFEIRKKQLGEEKQKLLEEKMAEEQELLERKKKEEKILCSLFTRNFHCYISIKLSCLQRKTRNKIP